MAPPTSAQYSLTLRVRIPDRPGMLGRVATAIGEAGATIGAIDLIALDEAHTVRDVTVEAASADHWDAILDAIRQIAGVAVVDATDRTLRLHVGGKIELRNKVPLKSRADLSMA